MSDRELNSNLDGPAIEKAQFERRDDKFRAASNVDRDKDGKIVNGPYEHPADYDETATRVANDRSLFVGDDPGFLGRDGTDGLTLVQPGLAQPNGAIILPRDPGEPAVERE